jgi:hypothetical protein
VVVLLQKLALGLTWRFGSSEENVHISDCDGGHGGNGKSENFELHFDGLVGF